MNKKRSLFQALLLRIHYKTSLALVSVFLGVLAFSGFYFFGQNIVNEADEQQRLARIQMNEAREAERVQDTENIISPTVSEEPKTDTSINIGGHSESVVSSPTVPVTTTPSSTVTPTATPTATLSPMPQLNAAKFVVGDPNAEKSIIAYYDFECVYCAGFIKDVFPQLKQEYLDTGKAKMIFKNFPLANHPTAPVAHNAAMCASVKGSFWEFHNILFAKQTEWSGKSSTEAAKLMKSYFKQLGIQDSQFDSCVDTNAYANYIDSDKKSGKDAGVTGTPTFIVGDEIIVGAQPIESFREILDAQ